MSKSLGKYIKRKIAGESYRAYIPEDLNSIEIDLNKIYSYLEKASTKLAELNSVNIPNVSLFIYMYVRKEALLSSQIEGTQSSFSDLILFENSEKLNISEDDVEEVSNYVKAIYFAQKSMRGKLPLSLRLIRETHGILLSGIRGGDKLPGEFRKSQNWVGGTRPGNAIFVPPPAEYLNGCLDDFEKFLHKQNIPALIKAALAHLWFETIHPFLDGNGRLGRILVTLILQNENLLKEPILYLSLYLKQNRQIYYDLLQETRNHDNLQAWLEFFLEGISNVCSQAIDTANKINELLIKDQNKIDELGRARFNILKVFEYLKKVPQTSSLVICEKLDISSPTTRMALDSLVKLGILEEISGKKRDKIYKYTKYLSLLAEGCEPL